MQSNEVVEIEYQSHPSVVVNPWMVITQQASPVKEILTGLWNTEQAAEFLSISPETLRRLGLLSSRSPRANTGSAKLTLSSTSTAAETFENRRSKLGRNVK
jgi:hypothetical protein